MEEKLGVKKAAARLHLSVGYLYILIHERRIPFHKRPSKTERGGHVWFLAAELDAWNDSGRVEMEK